MKPAAQSKQIWFAVLLAVLGVLEAQQGALQALLGDKALPAVLLVTALVQAVLRVLTTQAIVFGTKDE